MVFNLGVSRSGVHRFSLRGSFEWSARCAYVLVYFFVRRASCARGILILQSWERVSPDEEKARMIDLENYYSADTMLRFLNDCTLDSGNDFIINATGCDAGDTGQVDLSFEYTSAGVADKRDHKSGQTFTHEHNIAFWPDSLSVLVNGGSWNVCQLDMVIEIPLARNNWARGYVNLEQHSVRWKWTLIQPPGRSYTRRRVSQRIEGAVPEGISVKLQTLPNLAFNGERLTCSFSGEVHRRPWSADVWVLVSNPVVNEIVQDDVLESTESVPLPDVPQSSKHFNTYLVKDDTESV